MCYCFIASLKNKRHVVIIIILSNQVVTAAIRAGCFKNNFKKSPFSFHRSSLWRVNCFSPPPFFGDFDPGCMSVYLNNRKTSSTFSFFSAVKIISLQRLKEASITTRLTAAAL